MAKKMKKRAFKKATGIVFDQYYKFADALPTEEDQDAAYAWLENLCETSAPKSVRFGVLYDKMDEMYDLIVKHVEK